MVANFQLQLLPVNMMKDRMSRWTQCLRGTDMLNCKLLSMIWKQNLIIEREEGRKKARNENKVSHNWRAEALKVFSVAAKSPNLELRKLVKGTKDWTEIILDVLSSFRFIFLNHGTESQQNPLELITVTLLWN